MHAYEQAATPQRFKQLQQLVEAEVNRESKLQHRYAELMARKKAV